MGLKTMGLTKQQREHYNAGIQIYYMPKESNVMVYQVTLPKEIIDFMGELGKVDKKYIFQYDSPQIMSSMIFRDIMSADRRTRKAYKVINEIQNGKRKPNRAKSRNMEKSRIYISIRNDHWDKLMNWTGDESTMTISNAVREIMTAWYNNIKWKEDILQLLD